MKEHALHTCMCLTRQESKKSFRDTDNSHPSDARLVAISVLILKEYPKFFIFIGGVFRLGKFKNTSMQNSKIKPTLAFSDL